MNEKTALVLEGGSLRCMFTAGVLDTFLERGPDFPCVAGVSAGALSGINYVSGQCGRTARVNLRFVNDRRYMGMRSLMRHHSIFNFDFLFGEVSDTLEPLDREAFQSSPKRFVAFTTDVKTGESVPHEKGKSEDIFMASRASGSMPLLSPIVRVDGRLCLDGGVAMAIPFQWAIDEGYEKIVLVLTRQEGYRKKPVSQAMARAYVSRYHRYPALVERLMAIPSHYNELQEEVEQLQRDGRIFVIRPDRPVAVSRIEKDVERLRALYREGRRIAAERMEALLEYLG